MFHAPSDKIRTSCSTHLINLSYLKGYFYTATKDLFTPQNPTVKFVQEKALPALCPEKEHQQIMPVSNGSTLFLSLKP